MEGIKEALWRARLKFLFCVSYVVKTAANSIKGKGSLYPCWCRAEMGVRCFFVNTCDGFCGGKENMKFPSDNFSACWSTRWRGKRLPAS
jgi:hypothetical protein